MVLMLVCHWVACFWSMALNLGDTYEYSWYEALEDEGPRDSVSTYIAAFYFACYTITSVGFGDIVPRNVVERSMCSFILIGAGLAWAYILGEVGAIVSDMTSESQEFRRRMHHLNVMMKEQSPLRVHESLSGGVEAASGALQEDEELLLPEPAPLGSLDFDCSRT